MALLCRDSAASFCSSQEAATVFWTSIWDGQFTEQFVFITCQPDVAVLVALCGAVMLLLLLDRLPSVAASQKS